MYVRQIERTELNGMVLQYTQSLPEICYNGLVLCFIAFDGDINGVGTRLANLDADEFLTFKTLINMIEFEDEGKTDYAELAKQAMLMIKMTADRALEEFDNWDGVSCWDMDVIKKKLLEIEFINAKQE